MTCYERGQPEIEMVRKWRSGPNVRANHDHSYIVCLSDIIQHVFILSKYASFIRILMSSHAILEYLHPSESRIYSIQRP
jgi:hypothetical protein